MSTILVGQQLLSAGVVGPLPLSSQEAPEVRASGKTNRKVVLRNGVALSVIERVVEPEAVGDSAGGAARNEAISAYESMSEAAQEEVAEDVIGKDEVAGKIYGAADHQTAGADDDLIAARENHVFYLYQIVGDVAPEPGSQKNRPKPPYPTRYIEHTPIRASLRLLREDATGKGGASTFTNLFATSDFFLQRVSEPDAEKYQIVETFGKAITYFFKNGRPVIYTFAGTFLNTANLSWANNFQQDYKRELRGSRAIESRARTYIAYDQKVVEGFLLALDVSRDSESPNGVSFVFNLLVTGEHFINGVSETGERQIDELAYEALQTGHWSTYRGGQDPFSNVDPKDQVSSIDPMKVSSMQELEGLTSGVAVPEGNASTFLASERFILSHSGPVPIVGFVAVPQAEFDEGLLSVTFSDPLVDAASVNGQLRQRVAEKPEGLVTVPQESAHGGGLVWLPTRSSPIRRVVVMDMRKSLTDRSALESLSAGNVASPHYLVCRGDSAHPFTETNIAPGSIIQLVQERYTAKVLGPAVFAEGATGSGTCATDYPKLIGEGKPLLRASDLSSSGAKRKFISYFENAENAGLGLPGINASTLLTAGIGKWRGDTFIVSSTIESLVSSGSGGAIVGSAGGGLAGLWAGSLVKQFGVTVNGESLLASDLMSMMAGMLYIESGKDDQGSFVWEGPRSVGPATPNSRTGSAAGIAQFLHATAVEEGMQITRPIMRETKGYSLNGWNVMPSGNVRQGTFTRGQLGHSAYAWRITDNIGVAYDDRFDAMRSVIKSARYLLKNIKWQAGGIRRPIPLPASLWDAVLFGFAAYNQGVGTILDFRAAREAVEPGAAASFCRTFADLESVSNQSLRFRAAHAKNEYVDLIVRYWHEKTRDRVTSDAEESSAPAQVDPDQTDVDAGTIYVALNGPGGTQPYQVAQLHSLVRLLNDIRRRNASVELWGRKHLGGVEKRGDELALRFPDPVTVNTLADALKPYGFDFTYEDGPVQLDQKLAAGGEEKNTERTRKGTGTQWWEEA